MWYELKYENQPLEYKKQNLAIPIVVNFVFIFLIATKKDEIQSQRRAQVGRNLLLMGLQVVFMAMPKWIMIYTFAWIMLEICAAGYGVYQRVVFLVRKYRRTHGWLRKVADGSKQYYSSKKAKDKVDTEKEEESKTGQEGKDNLDDSQMQSLKDSKSELKERKKSSNNKREEKSKSDKLKAQNRIQSPIKPSEGLQGSLKQVDITKKKASAG